MAKTRQISGTATVIDTGSSCVGCMAWETPYIKIKMHGETFRYQSDRVEHLGLDKYDIIVCNMRVKDNGNIWRFELVDRFTGI